VKAVDCCTYPSPDVRVRLFGVRGARQQFTTFRDLRSLAWKNKPSEKNCDTHLLPGLGVKITWDIENKALLLK